MPHYDTTHTYHTWHTTSPNTRPAVPFTAALDPYVRFQLALRLGLRLMPPGNGIFTHFLLHGCLFVSFGNISVAIGVWWCARWASVDASSIVWQSVMLRPNCAGIQIGTVWKGSSELSNRDVHSGPPSTRMGDGCAPFNVCSTFPVLTYSALRAPSWFQAS